MKYWIEVSGRPDHPVYRWCVELPNGEMWRSESCFMTERSARETAEETFKHTPCDVEVRRRGEP